MKKLILSICLYGLHAVTHCSQAQLKLANGYFGVIANSTADSIKGPQIAALFNSAEKHVIGSQISGLFNYAGSLNGSQITGLFNVSRKTANGVQIAGLLNTADTLYGMQVGGLFNYCASNTVGAQVAGLFNESKNVMGTQLAGLFNNAEIVNGVQISGLVNHATKVNGLQIGFINISDSCNGAPLGFFSYVKHGYHKIEVAVTESKLLTVGLRSGTEKFHNIFFTGADIGSKATVFTYGYGIGSSFYVSKWWNVGLDITSQQILPVEANRTRLHLLNKAQLNVEFKALPKLWLSVAPTFNVMVSDLHSPYHNQLTSFFKPTTFYEVNNNLTDVNTQFWFGANISVKIF